MQDQERQLVDLLIANDNAIDISVCGEGLRVATLGCPVVSGVGINILKALMVAASRKKTYVRKNVGFMDTNALIIEYEYNFGPLESLEKPTIEGMNALLVKRCPLQVYFRDGEMHILVREGIQIQGHGASLFQALTDAVRNLKVFAKRNDILYSEILDDIEIYERHYGEIL